MIPRDRATGCWLGCLSLAVLLILVIVALVAQS